MAQAVTNQLQALAASATNRLLAALGVTNRAAPAATNQLQALTSSATNNLLTALGATNGAASTSTNFAVQALLEKAKILSSNQKYQEALTTLTTVYETQLTTEQKQQADALKSQIQTALAEKAVSGASSALGGFLGGKK